MNNFEVRTSVNKRIDQYLSEELNISRSQIKNMIENKQILVNQKTTKASYSPSVGDIISIEKRKEQSLLAEDILLDIVYEDEYIIVINKPYNMLVHPTPHEKRGTLVNGLLNYTDKLCNIESIRPGIVHRLDRTTSGVLVVAKTDHGYQHISKQFQAGEVKRIYKGVLEGHLEKEILVDKPIGRDKNNRTKMAVVDQGRNSKTIFNPVKYIDNYTLAQMELLTGRTHQIRVHSSFLGYPVVGDDIYGHPNYHGIDEILLHAYLLGFIHPGTEEWVEFKVEIPKRFNKILNRKFK